MAIVSTMIDAREPEWAQKLTFGNVPCIVTLLDAGDYLIATDNGDLLAVERKTASDLLNTLRDDRLYPQLVKLRETSPWCYLAICGILQPASGGKCFVNGIESGWNWASVEGALLTVQEIGIHILHIPSDAEFEAAIVRLGNRDRSPKRVTPARESAFVSEAESILTALPGIGSQRAQALLADCGSAGYALMCLTDDSFSGKKVRDIGPGTKARIRRALEMPDWAALGYVEKDIVLPSEKEKVTA